MSTSTIPVQVEASSTSLEQSRQLASVTVPRLTVIIVNYRHWHETARLVGQLRHDRAMLTGAAEVVIVDNYSPAHPLASRLRRLTGVSLRRWGRNRGFARAVNEGGRLSRGKWLLLLNPDVEVPEDFLHQVEARIAALERGDSRRGIVGFQLRHGDGSLQRSTGPFPTLLGTLGRLIRHRSHRKYDSQSLAAPCRVPWVTGCCLLVRQECLRDLGGMDEDYFLYYEDVDLCRRAQARGWSVWYDPTIRVVHHHPLHARAIDSPLRILTRHALLSYASKHWPRWQVPLLAGIIRLEAWLLRQRALWARDTREAELFADLSAIASDLAGGRERSARRRLKDVVLRRERYDDR